MNDPKNRDYFCFKFEINLCQGYLHKVKGPLNGRLNDRLPMS